MLGSGDARPKKSRTQCFCITPGSRVDAGNYDKGELIKFEKPLQEASARKFPGMLIQPKRKPCD